MPWPQRAVGPERKFRLGSKNHGESLERVFKLPGGCAKKGPQADRKSGKDHEEELP